MNVWEEIKSKLDIVDVISEYIPVQTAGSNYRALSPFKKEKTPSLMISPTKQIWHDFSTGKGGDIFGFVMQMENITRAEALRKLAEKAGVKLTKVSSREPELSEEHKTVLQAGYQALQWTAELYHSILKKVLTDRTHPVTRYCLERRLTPSIIEQFKIGYAPSNNFLLQFLLNNKKDTALFRTIELLIERSRKLKDKFSDRLMIPIRNLDGKVVGFTGRVLPHDTNKDRPKYLNSSQSEWFDKSALWFGLDLARKQITLEKKAIVVEGNMDVIAAFGSGYDYTIASQGTSFTLQQLKILSRFTKNVLLAFDNDSAGMVAAEKFYMTATPLGFLVQKVVIPDHFKDLDEMLGASRGQQTEIVSESFLDVWIDQNNPRLTSVKTEEQKQAIQEICMLLSVVDDITLEQYIKKIHTITSISTATLTKLIKINKDKQSKTRVKEDLSTALVRQGIEQSGNQAFQQNLTISWQKLNAILINNPEEAPKELMEKLYTLLNEFSVFAEKSYHQFLEQHKDELQFIAEESEMNQDLNALLLHMTNLEKLIDSRISAFLNEPEALQKYYETKQLLEQFKRTVQGA